MKRLLWFLAALLVLTLVVALVACSKPGKEEPSPAAQALSGPPKIQHALDEREGNCVSCHTTAGNGIGVLGGVGVSSSHNGRTNDQCKMCHQPR